MFNRYIVVPFVVWAIAQFLKFILAAFKGRIDFRYLYGSGGMPSVHSAVVTSLAVTALLVDGIHSAIFGVTIIFAAIVMYDSFGVRRSAGEQAIAINQILDSMDQDHLEHPRIHLREILGHKPLEVTLGAVLGLFLGCLFNYDKLGALFALFTLPVGIGLIIILAAAAVILLIAGIVARFLLLRRYRRVEIAEQAVKRESWVAYGFALLGLLLAFVQYEKIAAALWIIWPALYVLLLIGAALLVWLPYRGGKIATAVAARAAVADKDKWLEGPNKKRRAKAARAKKRK
ncbi:MAG TPA: divergent PAP2 family protein [Candidatus Saccharimonadales bacterium]|nr:divergent PAP2 family protein [Candidatus Saccharimonadales bacterium]